MLLAYDVQRIMRRTITNLVKAGCANFGFEILTPFMA
jgi:hypothetical protein